MNEQQVSVFELRKHIWCFVHNVKKQVVYKKVKKKEVNIFGRKVCVECLEELLPTDKPKVIKIG